MTADSFTIKLLPLVIPAMSDLLPETQERLMKLDGTLCHTERCHTGPLWENVSTEWLEKLKHRLSTHYMARQIEGKHEGRTCYERHLINAFSLSYNDIVKRGDFDAFWHFLSHWSGQISSQRSGVRTTAMRSSPDVNGCYIRYIDYEYLVDGMKQIWTLIINAPSLCLFSAVVSTTALLAYHPFYDGNGRFCRLLLNVMLKRDQDNYIPFHDIYHQSYGGYFIRLRQAQLFGEWDEIVSFHCDILDYLVSGNPNHGQQ